MKALRALATAFGIAAATLVAGQASAAQTNVAVAANFTDAAKEIAAAFKAKTGHEAVLSFGSSGQLYTQITQDAPFQVFLSADDERPKKAVDDGLGVADSRFTYAIGKLVLWSKNPDVVKGEETLDGRQVRQDRHHQSGRRALWRRRRRDDEDAEALRHPAAEVRRGREHHPGLPVRRYRQCRARLRRAVAARRQAPAGSRWLVPQNLYQPIRQDAVLLKKGADNPAATGFIDFLKGPEARAIIEKYGYVRDANS